MVSADSVGVPRDPTYSGYFKLINLFTYGTLTLCGRPFHAVLLRRLILYEVLQPQNENRSGLGSFPSLAATEEIDFSFFSCKYLDVSVPCVCPV